MSLALKSTTNFACGNHEQEGQIEDTFVEVIGMVEDSNVLKLQACINLGGELGECFFYPSVRLDTRQIADHFRFVTFLRIGHRFESLHQ